METQLTEMGEMVCARHLIPAGFADGGELEVAAGDSFHVRSGHLADVLEEAELIEFTRAEEYRRKAAHLRRG